MKKATLAHLEGDGFTLVDESNEAIARVDVGDIDGDIDWGLVESKANELGYTLY